MPKLPLGKIILLSFLGTLSLLFQGCNPTSSTAKTDFPPYRGYYHIAFSPAKSKIHLDSSYSLVWTHSDSIQDPLAQLALYQNDSLVKILDSNSANSGTLAFSPRNFKLGSGAKYRIRILNSAKAHQWDATDSFSIYSQFVGTLSIIYPMANSQVRLDSMTSLRWANSGSVGNQSQILLYKGAIILDTVDKTAMNSGFYSWTPSSAKYATGTDYRLRLISNGDPSVQAMSAYFSLVPGYEGALILNKPTTGDTLVSGNAHAVAWSWTGSPGNTLSLQLVRDSLPLQMLTNNYSLYANNFYWTIPAGFPTSSRYRILIRSLKKSENFSYSNYFSIRGVDLDSFEIDNLITQSKPIPTDGFKQQRTLTYQDTDWVHFEAPSNKKCLVNLKSASTYTVLLADSNGVPLLSQSGSQLQLWLSPKYAGRHKIRVTSYSGLGPYSLSVLAYDSLQAGFPFKWIAPDSNSVWKTGVTSSILWSPDSLLLGSNIRLDLYRDNATILTQTAYAPNTGSYSWAIPAGLGSSNQYRIRLVNSNNISIFGFSPRFKIEGIPSDSFENDNRMKNANSILESSLQSHTMSYLDSDWVQINTIPDRGYIANVQSGFTLNATLFDSAGLMLQSYSGLQKQISLAPNSKAKRYYLLLYFYASTSNQGNYTISLFGYDPVLTGYPITFSSPQTNVIWDAGTSRPINWLTDTLLFGNQVSLNLCRDTTVLMPMAMAINNSGAYTWSIPQGLALASNYRIRLHSTANPQLFGFSPIFTINGILSDGDRGSAKPLVADGLPQSHTLSLSDTDWMAMQILPGRKYAASVQSNFALKVQVLDSNGLQTSTYSGSKLQWVLDARYLGKQFIRILPSSLSPGFQGSYTIALFVSDSLFGFPVRFITPNGSTTWNSSTTQPISFEADSTFYGSKVQLSLYRASTGLTTLSSSLSNIGFYSWSIPTGLLTANDYQLRITSLTNPLFFGSSPPFSIMGLVPDSLEPNDLASSSKTLLPNLGKRNLSLSFQDQDWFRFNAVSGMVYVWKTQSAYPTTLTLFSGLGISPSLAQSTQSITDTANILTWVCTTTGPYSVSITTASSLNAGPYTLDFTETTKTQLQMQITSPMAGEIVARNFVTSIQWTHALEVGGKVDIFLYHAAGQIQTIASNLANGGAYNWNVPDALVPGSDYFIRVVSRISSDFSGDSKVFTVE